MKAAILLLRPSPKYPKKYMIKGISCEIGVFKLGVSEYGEMVFKYSFKL